jgi:hypothetical protein
MNITADVNGEGKKLYTVILIDTDDHEDSSIQMWKANDEDDLYNQILEDYLGYSLDNAEEVENNMMHYQVVSNFEEDWGFEILFKEIGEL